MVKYAQNSVYLNNEWSQTLGAVKTMEQKLFALLIQISIQ